MGTNFETQTALEKRLRDKSATIVSINKLKNRKTKIVMKFIDISQPKQWGFTIENKENKDSQIDVESFQDGEFQSQTFIEQM